MSLREGKDNSFAGKKIFANCISAKGLVFRTYTDQLKFNDKKMIKNGQMIWRGASPKKYANDK